MAEKEPENIDKCSQEDLEAARLLAKEGEEAIKKAEESGNFVLETRAKIACAILDMEKLGLTLSAAKEAAEREQMEEALQNNLYASEKRVKELTCLYNISSMLSLLGLPTIQVLQLIVGCLPDGWQFPDITCARITINDQEYQTENFKETGWRQVCDIFVAGKQVGAIEVFYLEEKPVELEGPFLAEEKNLLNAIGEMIQSYIEQKQAGEKLTHRREMEYQSQKIESIGQLAGGIAHDFNNLLMIIISNAEVMAMEIERLDENGEDAERIELLLKFLEEIEKASIRAAELTSYLLVYSRRKELYPKIININETVNNAIEMLRRMVAEDISWSIELGEKMHNIKADPAHLEQVIVNLAINAKDAIKESKGEDHTIYIETKNIVIGDEYEANINELKPGNYVMLSVEDHGCGISDENLEQIFDPFFTTKEPGKGTGLGLSMVMGVIKKMGGDIHIENKLEKGGTRFEILLPATDEVAEKIGSKDGVSEIPGGTETILLVEDDMAILRITKRLLEKAGYTVLTANNSKEAEVILGQRAKDIQLVLSDIVMPGKSGIELVKQIRASHPGIATILMSGCPQEDYEVDFMQKPVERPKLLGHIREKLDSRKEGSGESS